MKNINLETNNLVVRDTDSLENYSLKLIDIDLISTSMDSTIRNFFNFESVMNVGINHVELLKLLYTLDLENKIEQSNRDLIRSIFKNQSIISRLPIHYLDSFDRKAEVVLNNYSFMLAISIIIAIYFDSQYPKQRSAPNPGIHALWKNIISKMMQSLIACEKINSKISSHFSKGEDIPANLRKEIILFLHSIESLNVDIARIARSANSRKNSKLLRKMHKDGKILSNENNQELIRYFNNLRLSIINRTKLDNDEHIAAVNALYDQISPIAAFNYLVSTICYAQQIEILFKLANRKESLANYLYEQDKRFYRHSLHQRRGSYDEKNP